MPEESGRRPEPDAAPEAPTPAGRAESANAAATLEASRREKVTGWRRFLPYPFEVVSLVGLVTAVAFLRGRGLRIDWVTFDYTIPPLLVPMAQSFLVGIVLHAGWVALRRDSVRRYLRAVVKPGWLLLLTRLWIACLAFTYTYFWLKVCVPLVNPRLWDGLFWRLDIALHLGFSPNLFLARLVQGTPVAALLDLWYALWLPSVTYGIAFFVASVGARTRRRFVLSCILTWSIGAWLYVALPALGPVYAFQQALREVPIATPRAVGGQGLLWENYQKVVAGRSGPLRQFNPTRGVAAFPSLHVGGHWLLMLWVRRRMRPLFAVAAVGTLLTFLGSLVTGWHYAVDGYAGILVAQFAYWAALRLESGRPGEPDLPPIDEAAADRSG